MVVAAGSTVLRSLLMENACEDWLALFQGRGQEFAISVNKSAMEPLAVFLSLLWKDNVHKVDLPSQKESNIEDRTI